MSHLSAISELINVTKIYSRSGADTKALQNISFSAFPSELVLLLGPSGSGKTTMLTIMAGLQNPSMGNVYLFGKGVEDYSNQEFQKIRAARIGFIFQTFRLIDSLNVVENIMLALKFAGYNKNAAYNKTFEFLERMGIKHLSKAIPHTLSQGEKQRVAVARALAAGAELIIADEPTGSLATDQGMSIVDFIHKSCIEEGRCAVIASHDERISGFAHRIFKLNDGILEKVR